MAQPEYKHVYLGSGEDFVTEFSVIFLLLLLFNGLSLFEN